MTSRGKGYDFSRFVTLPDKVANDFPWEGLRLVEQTSTTVYLMLLNDFRGKGYDNAVFRPLRLGRLLNDFPWEGLRLANQASDFSIRLVTE